MQRRAAAAYVAIFVLIAAGSYGVIATAQAPHVDLPSSAVDQKVAVGQSFTVNGTEYTLSKVKKTGGGGGGGHGGGGGAATFEGTITWNVTVEKTETLDNGSVVNGSQVPSLPNGTDFTVVVPDESDPSAFRLVENFTITEPTVTRDGTTYVVLRGEGNNRTLVPKDDYLRRTYGQPRTLDVSEGDVWNGTRGSTVANVTRKKVIISWSAVEQQKTSVKEGGNVTVGGTKFTAHFPSKNGVELTKDYGAYRKEQQQITKFHHRKSGLWYVAALSGFVAVLLLALAYLPNKGD